MPGVSPFKRAGMSSVYHWSRGHAPRGTWPEGTEGMRSPHKADQCTAAKVQARFETNGNVPRRHNRALANECRMFVDELEASGWEIGPMTLTTAISVLGYAPWHLASGLAARYFRRIRRRDRCAYTALLMVHKGHWGFFDKTWRAMLREGVKPSEPMYCLRVRAMFIRDSERGTLPSEQTEDILAQVLESGAAPTRMLMNALISSARSLPEVNRYLEAMRERRIEKDIVTYSSLIVRCGKLSRSSALAEKLFAEAVDAGCSTSAVAFGALMSVYHYLHDHPGVLRVAARMKKEGHELTVQSRTLLLHSAAANCRAARGKQVAAALAETEAVFMRCLDDGMNYLNLWRVLLTLYLELGEMRKAAKLLAAMRRAGFKMLRTERDVMRRLKEAAAAQDKPPPSASDSPQLPLPAFEDEVDLWRDGVGATRKRGFQYGCDLLIDVD
eukprot:TRINITY_DN16302_c0_g1_i1.p1 TRINITY_DN16302_c0_g1~~TRINITY_DN16302_c0_g1_i1.p1  ORF type:complete len:468 (+),score=124.51 TRINITY_DN16302_c0_g1_i1:81-1406(+)